MKERRRTFRRVHTALNFIRDKIGARKVITFMGFSGSGYEHRERVEDLIRSILDNYSPSNFIVNAGATKDGIGMVYPTAKNMGFITTGIVSTQAKKYQAEISDHVDYVLFMQDATWGGFIESTSKKNQTKKLSLTSAVMVEVSDVIHAIGGGAVSRDELIVASEKGKEVYFVPAEKNHTIAINNARKKNQPLPTDFRGQLELYWNTLRK
ncbi:MAG: hypothetical protein HKN76_15500 [Saprospiraceae bacterium]|nr:hypothetical protein [Saprospiraceae bacterium]